MYRLMIGVLLLAFALSLSCGGDKSNTPTNHVPTVTTSNVSFVMYTTALCGGNVISDGGDSVYYRGVCWSTNPTPTYADSRTYDGAGIGQFVSSITGLSAGTHYYVRAYAMNDIGVGYGAVDTFTTVSETDIWRVYNTGNSGIANNTVFDVEIDRDGVKWICTNEGLSSFDGANWTTYKMNNSPLPANIVTTITVDSNNVKWIGTKGIYAPGGGGMAKFDGTNWTTYTPSNSPIPDDWVTSIVIDQSGKKWIGTDNGLVTFDDSNWVTYPSNYQTYYYSVASLALDAGDTLWVATGWRLSRYDGATWMIFGTGNSGLHSENIWDVKIDGNYTKWICTNLGGLTKFDGINWTTYDSANSGIGSNNPRSIDFDSQGNQWIGTWEAGLVKFDGANWTVFDTANSAIPTNVIYDVKVDGNDNKWIATFRGLAVYNENGIQ